MLEPFYKKTVIPQAKETIWITGRPFVKVKYFKGLTTAMYRSSTKQQKFVTEANPNSHLTIGYPVRLYTAASCHLTEKHWWNNAYPNTTIRHCEWNDKSVGFGGKLTFAANKKDNKSVSSYGQDGKTPAKNPKPDFHFSAAVKCFLSNDVNIFICEIYFISKTPVYLIQTLKAFSWCNEIG